MLLIENVKKYIATSHGHQPPMCATLVTQHLLSLHTCYPPPSPKKMLGSLPWVSPTLYSIDNNSKKHPPLPWISLSLSLSLSLSHTHTQRERESTHTILYSQIHNYQVPILQHTTYKTPIEPPRDKLKWLLLFL